ncbi:MAG: hypothetical protein AB1782_10750 [Cyanobacteriota bacterium]
MSHQKKITDFFPAKELQRIENTPDIYNKNISGIESQDVYTTAQRLEIFCAFVKSWENEHFHGIILNMSHTAFNMIQQAIFDKFLACAYWRMPNGTKGMSWKSEDEKLSYHHLLKQLLFVFHERNDFTKEEMELFDDILTMDTDFKKLTKVS